MTYGTPPELAEEARRTLVGERLEAVSALLAGHGAEGVILSSRRNFAWLTAGGLNHVVLASESGAAPILVKRGGAVVLAPVNEAARIADEELAGLSLEVEELAWWDGEAANRAAQAHVGQGRLLEEALLEDELTSLRERLGPAERVRLNWLGSLVGGVTDAVLASAGPGTTERELEAQAVGRLAAAGARCPVVLVAADDRIDRYRHPLATQREVKDRVMLVLVAERWGLHAALTGIRELAEPSADLMRRTHAVMSVLAAMRESTVPGRTLGEVLAAAQGRYADTGFPEEWRLHHQGGTIGYQGRERIAGPGDAAIIAPGMAFAWNPSIRGAKAEETFYLDDDGTPHVVTG